MVDDLANALVSGEAQERLHMHIGARPRISTGSGMVDSVVLNPVAAVLINKVVFDQVFAIRTPSFCHDYPASLTGRKVTLRYSQGSSWSGKWPSSVSNSCESMFWIQSVVGAFGSDCFLNVRGTALLGSGCKLGDVVADALRSRSFNAGRPLDD